MLHDESSGRCLRLALDPERSIHGELPRYGDLRVSSAIERLWEPLRRLKNVREIELAGLLTSEAAEALSLSMTSPST